MRLFPKTGRSHQLRVHMLALGHPILGDPFYASGEASRPLAPHAPRRRAAPAPPRRRQRHALFRQSTLLAASTLTQASQPASATLVLLERSPECPLLQEPGGHGLCTQCARFSPPRFRASSAPLTPPRAGPFCVLGVVRPARNCLHFKEVIKPPFAAFAAIARLLHPAKRRARPSGPDRSSRPCPSASCAPCG